MCRDLVCLEQCHVLDDQPQHALPLTRRELGIIPDPGKIGCERQNFFPGLLVCSAALLLSLPLVFFLYRSVGAQFFIPLCLQDISDQAIAIYRRRANSAS